MGTYKLEALVGQGGSSRVYSAVQQSVLRLVAVKIFSPVLAIDRVLPKRFDQEARILVRLNHPNLVDLYDIGKTAGGLPFFVMELLQGQTLAEFIDAHGPMDVDRAGRVARQLLTGLSVVHERGIVHRDVKPSNVFLCEVDGVSELVKLLDFGIAKVVEPDEAAGLPGLSTERLGGGVVGSPRYMAPEVFKKEPLSPATDLFSFGLTMAELIGGAPVLSQRSDAEIIRALISGGPLDLREEVRRSPFGPFLGRCLQKDPQARYPSADEALCDLVAAGLGGEETVQFSTAEALSRYEAMVRSLEMARTRTFHGKKADVEADLPGVEVKERPKEAAGRSGGAGPGASPQDLKSSLPGFTAAMDAEAAAVEAAAAAGPSREPTRHTASSPSVEGAEKSAWVLYGVAAAAIVAALAILGLGMAAIWLLSEDGDKPAKKSNDNARIEVDGEDNP